MNILTFCQVDEFGNFTLKIGSLKFEREFILIDKT